MSRANEAPVPPPARVAPLMPVALAVAAGVVIDRYAEPLRTPAWSALALGLAALGLAAARRKWAGAVVLLGAWGALAGAWHHYRWSDLAGDDLARTATEIPKPAWLRGTVRDVLGYRPGADGDEGATRVVLDVTEVQSLGEWRKASGRAVMTVVGERTELKPGDGVEAAGNLAKVAGPMNPGEFDYRAHLRAQGTRLRFTVDSPAGVRPTAEASRTVPGLLRAVNAGRGAVREWSRKTLSKNVDPRAEPLAEALLLGRRDGLDLELNDAFARTGTTHLLAISGLHMQALGLALGALLRLLGLRRKPTFIAVGTATIAYALLVGLMASVVRSAAMTGTYCLAGLFDRPRRPTDTLAAAGIVTLALNPAYLFDVGCQLSFLAVAVIIWGAGPVARTVMPERPSDPLAAMERAFEPLWRRWVRRALAWGVRGVALSGLVWLAAVPLVALRFHIVSPVGVLLNVPLIPMTSAALLTAGVSLLSGGVWTSLGRPAGLATAWLLDATAAVVRWGAARGWGHAFVPEPAWAWVLGFYATLALATAARLGRWPGRRAATGLFITWSAAGVVLAVAPGAVTLSRPGDAPRADVLAVGHGLAVVVETGGGRGVLYDCGRMRDPSVGRRVVAPALWARGIRRLDAVVLSHADADHYNGLPDLLDRVPVARVLVHEGFASAANPGAVELLDRVRSKGVTVQTVAAGHSWDAGATRFTVRHPPEGWEPSAPDNARSLVLDVSWHGRHALLTGDLEGEGLATFTSEPTGGPIDVLLSPHHGGRTANPSWLYDWAEAGAVVVSQRPLPPGSRDPLDALDDRGTPVWRTWQSGAVRLTWEEEGIRVQGFLDEP